MELTAGDIMSTPVICARAEMTVAELIDLLDAKRISGVPVVDDENRLVGVISITDLIVLGADHQNSDPIGDSDFHTSPAMDSLASVGGLLQPAAELMDRKIADFMSSKVIAAAATDSIGRLADLMVESRIHRLVIVRQEKIAGIVSIRDILCALQARYRSSEQG